MNCIPPKIPEEDLKRSLILSTICDESDKPVVFMPNYGEFGPIIDKVIKLVHFFKAPEKIVCCQPGEESFYPSADGFYYDWTYDLIAEKHRWGTFTKRKLSIASGVRENNIDYQKYKKLTAEESDRIQAHFGPEYNHISMWSFGPDMIWAKKYSHLFRFEFPDKKVLSSQPDIVISPRKRESRPDNNFEHWGSFAQHMNNCGYSIGCVGIKKNSFPIEQSIENSWDYEDGSGAAIEMIKNCKLYVGLDTGTSHLAAFISPPMIVFQPNIPNYSGTWMMKNMSQGWYCDLGVNVKNYDIINKTAIEYLENSK